jgi:hypothetical protein
LACEYKITVKEKQLFGDANQFHALMLNNTFVCVLHSSEICLPFFLVEDYYVILIQIKGMHLKVYSFSFLVGIILDLMHEHSTETLITVIYMIILNYFS